MFLYLFSQIKTAEVILPEGLVMVIS